MSYRRIFWTINLVYSTKAEQLESICKDIEDYINTSENFVQNPGQENFVRVTELGSSSIDLTILCYMDVIDYTQFSQVKQELIFNIMLVVEKHGSEFAFPSRSIYIENQGPE